MPPHLAATWKINDLPQGTAVLAPATIRDASRDYNAGDGRGGTGCCRMPSNPDQTPRVALRVHDYRSNGVAQPLSRGQVVALHRFCL